MIHGNKIEPNNEKQNIKIQHKIDLRLHVDTNILIIKYVSVQWCSYVLSDTLVTFESQFMKKLSNTEAELI